MKFKPFAALGASLLVVGCASSPPPEILPLANAADPAFGIRGNPRIAAVTGYENRSPVEPKPWRKTGSGGGT